MWSPRTPAVNASEERALGEPGHRSFLSAASVKDDDSDDDDGWGDGNGVSHTEEQPTNGNGVIEAEEQPTLHTPRLNYCQWIILMSLNTIGAFSSDAYVPNLNAIASDLSASDEAVSLTIQVHATPSSPSKCTMPCHHRLLHVRCHVIIPY